MGDDPDSQSATTLGAKDQLGRAALSIPLNIAEGNGRWHKAEKKQFYWIARGSVFECVAVVQVMARMGLLRDEVVTEYYERLSEISKMLTVLVRSVDALKDKTSDSGILFGKSAT